MKFLFPKKEATPTRELGSKDGGFSSSEMKEWPSNSTIDSYCSTTGHMDSAMDLQDAYKGSTNSIKGLRRLSGSVNSLNKNIRRLSGSVNSIRSQRRASGVPGGWKVVRWKPVLDSGGDVWSDNQNMRQVVSTLTLTTSGPSTIEELPELPPRRNTSPPGSHLIPPSVLVAAPGLYNALGKSTTLSLPNIRLQPTAEEPSSSKLEGDKQPKSLWDQKTSSRIPEERHTKLVLSFPSNSSSETGMGTALKMTPCNSYVKRVILGSENGIRPSGIKNKYKYVYATMTI